MPYTGKIRGWWWQLYSASLWKSLHLRTTDAQPCSSWEFVSEQWSAHVTSTPPPLHGTTRTSIIAHTTETRYGKTNGVVIPMQRTTMLCVCKVLYKLFYYLRQRRTSCTYFLISTIYVHGASSPVHAVLVRRPSDMKDSGAASCISTNRQQWHRTPDRPKQKNVVPMQ